MKKVIATLTLAGLLTASFGLSVFAEDVVKLNEPKVTKHLEMAEGLEVPSETFNFTATAVTIDAPTATIGSISYGSTDDKGALSDEGKYILDKEAEITFGTFPHAGVYEYTVTEKAEGAEGITYDSKKYTLRVYVANNDAGNLDIRAITAEADGEKQDSLSFTNTYHKNGSLEITKTTVGDLADKTKDFAFTITFIKSGTESDEVISYTGKIGNEDVTCKIGEETTFYLHDGESLVFDNLPVGTRYVVTEKGVEDGYVPNVSVIENEVQMDSGNDAKDADALSTADSGSSNLVGEKANKVEFTNTYNDVPVTGLILNNLPFLLLVILPALALLLPAMVRFRMKKHGKH